MSEWAARLGLLFPDRVKADFDLFVEEANNENLHHLSPNKDYDELKETKPTYEQISQDRILDEANKNIQILKSLETILQERTQSYSTFFAAQGKYKPSFEIFQYCEGTLRQALDALFVFLEQELQQARQQQTLGDLRKALSEVKLNAQKRLSDYQREVSIVDKDVAVAEKKLAKSKEYLEKALEQKHRLESGDNDNTLQSPRRPLAITRYHSHRGDVNKQEKLRECLEGIARSDKDIKEGIQTLLKALSARDQVLVASRRAYQKLDKDCKKAVALTFRKLIIREREAAAARENVLTKLESAVDSIDVEADLEDFIVQHRQGDEGSLHCCLQALTVLGDLVPLEGQTGLDSLHTQRSTVSSRSTSRDREESHRTGQLTEDELSSPKPEGSAGSNLTSSRASRRQLQTVAYNAPTPIALAATATATLSYAVTTGLPLAEAFASIVSLCTGEKKKVEEDCIEMDDVSSEKIVEHLTRIFYCHWTSSSVESVLSSSSGSSRRKTFFMDQTITLAATGETGRTVGSETVCAVVGVGVVCDAKMDSPLVRPPGYVARFEGDESPQSNMTHPLNSPVKNSAGSAGGELDNPYRSYSSDSYKSIGKNQQMSPEKNQEQGDIPRNESILGTDIADDFYSSAGSCQTNYTPNGQGSLSELSENACSANLESSANWLSEIVKTQKGRDAFIIELNQFRSKKVEMGAGFVILGVVLWDVLDRCKEDNDVHSAKVIMMLSQTFYRRLDQQSYSKKRSGLALKSDSKSLSERSLEFLKHSSSPSRKILDIKVNKEGGPEDPSMSHPSNVNNMHIDESDGSDGEFEGQSDDVGDDDRLANRGAGSREYLKTALMAHDIWKDRSFWEQALWQCTMEQLHSIPYERAWHDLPEEQRLDPVRMVHSVIFSQVMAITHSMIELGCSKSLTRDFLHRMCVLHELSERQRQDLLMHLMSR